MKARALIDKIVESEFLTEAQGKALPWPSDEDLKTLATTHTVKEISDKLGISYNNTLHRLRSRGIKAKSNRNSYTLPSDEQLVELLKTRSVKTLSAELGIPFQQLGTLLRHRGIKSSVSASTQGTIKWPSDSELQRMAGVNTVNQLAAKLGVRYPDLYQRLIRRGITAKEPAKPARPLKPGESSKAGLPSDLSHDDIPDYRKEKDFWQNVFDYEAVR